MATTEQLRVIALKSLKVKEAFNQCANLLTLTLSRYTPNPVELHQTTLALHSVRRELDALVFCFQVLTMPSPIEPPPPNPPPAPDAPAAAQSSTPAPPPPGIPVSPAHPPRPQPHQEAPGFALK